FVIRHSSLNPMLPPVRSLFRSESVRFPLASPRNLIDKLLPGFTLKGSGVSAADPGNYVNFAPAQGSRLLRIRTEVLPMPRRSARSASTGGGDTNHTVLVIFLVFFVLISLTLGVFLYLAQEKISAADTAADKAKKDAQAAVKELSEYRDYFRAEFQSWVDPASLGEDELQTMQTLDKDETFRSKRPEKFAGLQKDMEGDPNANTTEAKNGLVGPMD